MNRCHQASCEDCIGCRAAAAAAAAVVDGVAAAADQDDDKAPENTAVTRRMEFVGVVAEET